MILIDANLLLYAVFDGDPKCVPARAWLDATLAGGESVALPWAVLGAFIRIATNRRATTNPLTLDEALAHVEEWLALPVVRVIGPTPRHREVFTRMLRGANATGNLVTDAHLAALAVEHGCRLASSDSDFARFHGLEWFNPVAEDVSGC